MTLTKEKYRYPWNTWKKIEKEMEKCILLCPNCHRWHHYTNGNNTR